MKMKELAQRLSQGFAALSCLEPMILLIHCMCMCVCVYVLLVCALLTQPAVVLARMESHIAPAIYN